MLSDGEFVVRLLNSLVADTLDSDQLDWSNETGSLMAEAARRFGDRDFAEVVRDFAPVDCELRRIGFVLEIVLNGYPGIDDVADTLSEWLESQVEAEFRCSIAVERILLTPLDRIEHTFSEKLERKWPQYCAQIRLLRGQWSSYEQKRF